MFTEVHGFWNVKYNRDGGIKMKVDNKTDENYGFEQV